MTGEMAWIKKDGTDSNGECWPIHASIARQLKGELHPFDVYQGPYIKVGKYKLWIVPFDMCDGYVRVLSEWYSGGNRIDMSGPFWSYSNQYKHGMNTRAACKAARELIKE